MDFKVADLCDEFGLKARVFQPIFHSFGANRQFSGQAVTIKCFEDNVLIKEMSQRKGYGKVLVVDAGGSDRCAVIGDVLGGNLVKQGWAGVILYGYMRDKAEVNRLSIGIKALGTNPRRCQQRGGGYIDEPIEFAGQMICPGDMIYADEDGVIILNETLR